jgi:hypothetical protein
MQYRVTSKDFQYTVKFLKKNGYTFNSSTKTWSGSKAVDFLVSEGYVVPPVAVVATKSEDLISNIEG